MAQVLLQNRVAIALPVLPDVVKAVGVTVLGSAHPRDLGGSMTCSAAA